MSVKRKNTKFDIVQFIDVDNERKSIDCVPSSWIFIEKKRNKIMAKFMPPPYTRKKCNALHKLVKANGNAPDNWPNYAINILESAGTYSEALSKIDKLLTHEDYIYTTDIEETVIEDKNINVRTNATEKHELPLLYDMKGNLLPTNRHSSSTDSSTENEAEELESLSEKHERLHLKRKMTDEFQEGETTLRPSTSNKEKPAQIRKPTSEPVTNDMSINVKKYLKTILLDVQVLKQDQQIIKNDMRILKKKFERYLINKSCSENDNNLTHWSEENNIVWPLKTKEEFDKLNILLQNQDIRKDFMATVGFIIDDGTAISKNLLAVIRKFLHKDLTTKFTCVKQIKDKFTLKPSLFYDCIIEVFCARRENMQQTFSEKILGKLIGTILTNSKDWEKKRPENDIEENGIEQNEDESEEKNE